jgi:hypothetical protein
MVHVCGTYSNCDWSIFKLIEFNFRDHFQILVHVQPKLRLSLSCVKVSTRWRLSAKVRLVIPLLSAQRHGCEWTFDQA